MKTIRRWVRSFECRSAQFGESGQAMAEVAIAPPLLLHMLIGIWDFARADLIQQVVVNAAREGAREVVLPERTEGGNTIGYRADAIATAEAYLAGGNVPCDNCVTITPAGEGSTGDPMSVTVQVPYSFNFIGPVIRLVTGSDSGPGDITLSSTATMRHE